MYLTQNVLKYNQEYISITEQFFVPWESIETTDLCLSLFKKKHLFYKPT